MKSTVCIVVACILACIGLRVSAQETDTCTALQKFIDSGVVGSDGTGVLICDIATGEVLAQHNADTPFIPASTMKAVTAAALYDVAEMNYCYETPVYYTGSITDTLLNGDIIIAGSGDPTINSDASPRSSDIITEIRHALIDMGIKTVAGQIRIDNSLCPGPSRPSSWSSGNARQYYGTGMYAFNFERNKKSSTAEDNPHEVFRRKLEASLGAGGIKVEKQSTTPHEPRRVLTIHRSAPLDEIMRSCMMRSDNMYAEALLRLVGIKTKGIGSLAASLQAEKEFLQKNIPDYSANIRILDGSGLSRDDRVTPRFLTDVLTRFSTEPYYASFFPLGGEEGTLRNFLKNTPLEGYVALKTGSMNGVQAYAGYLLDEEFVPTHTIVILMNQFASRSAARKGAEKLLLELFTSSQNIK